MKFEKTEIENSGEFVFKNVTLVMAGFVILAYSPREVRLPKESRNG